MAPSDSKCKTNQNWKIHQKFTVC